MWRQGLHYRRQGRPLQKFTWVTPGGSSRQKTASDWFDAPNQGERILVTLQTLSHSGATSKAKLLTDGCAMEVSLHQQHCALSFLSEGNGKIEGDRGLSIVRQRACNEKSFKFLRVPDLV